VKEIVAPAGERTRIIHRFSSSLSQTFAFDVEPVSGEGPVSGTVEVAGSRWLFSKPPVTLDLQPTMSVEKGFWDTRYSVYVTPDRDVKVTLGRPRLR
jgi:hypothetical protein